MDLRGACVEADVAVACERCAVIVDPCYEAERTTRRLLGSQDFAAVDAPHSVVGAPVDLVVVPLRAVDVEDAFIARLRANRGRDLDSGRTHEGPHATDFLVSHREKGRAAASCSTGEQKALLIRLVMACASLPAPGAPAKPILLLDEVAAHLDETRRRALFEEIDGLGVQSWLTGTDAPLFSGLEGRAQFMRVADGQVRPM